MIPKVLDTFLTWSEGLSLCKYNLGTDMVVTYLVLKQAMLLFHAKT